MQLGALEYLISIKDNNLQNDLNKSEEKVKNWGNKLSAWTVAKGQMIARFGEKVITSTANLMKNTVKSAIDAYGRYEQISEGAKLIWGDAYSYIENRAKKAYANVQMSALDYMEQANYYAVGLKTALNGDEQAAAKLADSIITAQADIVAALGVDAERVQNAFTGIMRGNYTMLDNLGLGIAGTKQGMEDVIKAVNDWNKANHVEKQYNMKSIADQQEALVKYVEMQGLAGYAQREGAETLQGSIASMKSAWQDLITNIGRGKDIKQAAKNFADSAKKALKNFRPVLVESIKGIITAAKELIPEIGNIVKDLIKELKESDSPIFQFIGNALNGIRKVFEWIMDNQQTVITAIGAILGAFSIFKIISIVSSMSPLTLMLGAIAGIATLIIENWGTIQEFFETLWAGVKSAVEDAYEAVSQWWTGVKESLSQTWGAIASWFDTTVWQPLSAGFEAIWGTLTQLWEGIKSSISNAWGAIATWFDTTVWQPLSEFFGNAWETIKGLWNDPLGAITTAWNAVVSWFDENIVKPLSGIFQPLVDLVNGIWNTVSSILGLDGKSSNIDVNIHQNVTKTITSVETDANGNTITNYDDGSNITEFSGGSTAGGHSFAKGNWSVPYDNYPALLHRGELVLNKSQARQFRDGETDYSTIGSIIGDAVNSAMSKVYVLMSGEKVGDLTTKRVKNNMNASSYSRLRAYGG